MQRIETSDATNPYTKLMQVNAGVWGDGVWGRDKRSLKLETAAYGRFKCNIESPVSELPAMDIH
jgi:hypothetical protein